MENKKCKRCGVIKPLSDFNKSKDKKDGYRSECRDCNKAYQIVYRNEHNNELKNYHHNYQMTVRPKKPRQPKLNKPHIKKRRTKEQREIYNTLIKQKRTLRTEEEKQRKRDFEKRWKDANPGIRIACNLRSRIWNALTGNRKCYKFYDVVGCDLDFLKLYLESKFTDGMSWTNYGQYGWHVDHIKPCDAFDFTDPLQQKECFHYTNLQPLWWLDNLTKSNKFSLV